MYTTNSLFNSVKSAELGKFFTRSDFESKIGKNAPNFNTFVKRGIVYPVAYETYYRLNEYDEIIECNRYYYMIANNPADKYKGMYAVYTSIHKNHEIENWFYGVYPTSDKANEVALDLGCNRVKGYWHCVCRYEEVDNFHVKGCLEG